MAKQNSSEFWMVWGRASKTDRRYHTLEAARTAAGELTIKNHAVYYVVKAVCVSRPAATAEITELTKAGK